MEENLCNCVCEHALEKIRKLEEKNAELEKRLSLLESRTVPMYKPNRSHRHKQTKRGRKPGFEGTNRRVPEKIDEVRELPVENCPHCSSPVETVVDIRSRFVEDVLPPMLFSKEYRIERRYCRVCRKNVYRKPLDVLPKCRLGITTLIYTIYQKFTLRLPYNKIAQHYALAGLRITAGALAKEIQIFARYLGPEFENLKAELRRAHAVNGDETSWRIDGMNSWLWAFISEKTAVYAIRHSRGRDVPKEILGENFEGVVGSDFHSAYSSFKKQQKCLVHLLRELDRVKDKNSGGEFLDFRRRLRRLITEARRLKERPLPLKVLERRRLLLYDRLLGIALVQYTDKDCVRLTKRIAKYHPHMLRFLFEDVDWNNNVAERAIRPNVVIRKISGGSRSWKGARAHEVIMSDIETRRLRNEDFFEHSTDYLRNCIL